MAAKRVEEIYEEHIEALPAVDRLRLVELIVRGLMATVAMMPLIPAAYWS